MVTAEEALITFHTDLEQSTSLVLTCHRYEPDGTFTFTQAEREQITSASFLNMFKAWERFLERVTSSLMAGSPTINGNFPTKIVSPPTIEHALELLCAPKRYFDFSNHDDFRKIVNLYFGNGYPFEPHLSAMASEFNDMKTIRNACAHISAATQKPLDSLATRLLKKVHSATSVYHLLLSPLPTRRSVVTPMDYYHEKLLLVSELIARG